LYESERRRMKKKRIEEDCDENIGYLCIASGEASDEVDIEDNR
jgi:hypothetical protein